MRLLVDTHVLLWTLRAPQFLSARATAAITDRRNELYVSSITAFEIATKARIGKLPGSEPLLLAWDEYAERLHADQLPLSSRHAIVAGRLIWDHRDPFDRILAAQSMVETMTLVTSDTVFRELGGVDVLWD